MQIKRGNKTVLALEIAFLLIAIIYIVLLPNASNLFRSIFLIAILLFFCIFSYSHLGYRTDHNYLKWPTIWLILANTLLFALILGAVGVFTDFTTEHFVLSWENVLQNILPLAIISVEIELFRYIVVSRAENNRPVIIAFVLISAAVFLGDIPHQIAGAGSDIVVIITTTLAVRILATSLVCTYLARHFGFAPALIYRLIVVLGMLVFPIWPQMSAWHSLILAIAFPIFTLIITRHHELFAERNHARARAFNLSFFSFPIIVILAFFFILNSGITGFNTLAIASNSMQPVYSRGDIVIYQECKLSEISVGDILVFKRGNRIITHRVVEIRGEGEDRRFIVKGDNNLTADDYSVSNDDVRGVVRIVGHYIGYPSLILNSISETEE